MKHKNHPKSLFRRHSVFPLIFTFLFLALLASSVAIVQQRQTLLSQAALPEHDQGEDCWRKNYITKYKWVHVATCKRALICSSRIISTSGGDKYRHCEKQSTYPGSPGGGGSGGGTANCGRAGQACCPSAFGNICTGGGYLHCVNNKCQSVSCGANSACPAGKECKNFGQGSVCVTKGTPGSPVGKAPATSNDCKAAGEAACFQGACPDGTESVGNKNCSVSNKTITCCKKVQTQGCTDKGGVCLDSCPAADGKTKVGGGGAGCFNGRVCCVKSGSAPPAAPADPGAGAPGGSAPVGGGGGSPPSSGGGGSGGGSGGGGSGSSPSTPTATTAPGSLGSVTLSLKLKFQGIVKQPASQFNKMTVKVSTSDTVKSTGEFTSDANGIWSGKVTLVGATVGGKVRVYVKGPKHIQKRICTAAPTEAKAGVYSCQDPAIVLKSGENSLDFSGILLFAGDLPPQDGVVDSSDVSYIRAHLTSTKSDELAIGDLNLDGVISTQDYSLVIAALSIKTDEAVK